MVSLPQSPGLSLHPGPGAVVTDLIVVWGKGDQSLWSLHCADIPPSAGHTAGVSGLQIKEGVNFRVKAGARAAERFHYR